MKHQTPSSATASEDQYLGCVLGLAIGDALGHPVEFLKSSEIRERYGPEGITGFQPKDWHPPGTYTDDTQMSLALARALLIAGDADDETLGTEVAREFVAWERSPENNRAPGMTCIDACDRLARGVPWREAANLYSKGCGTAMRSAPVGLYYHGNLDRLVSVARLTNGITHGHPCAAAGSAATALLVSLALERTSPTMMLARLCGVAEPISFDFTEKIRQVPEALAQDPEDAFKILGGGWIAEDAVACALYCFLRAPDDYRATVLTAANSSGDSDSIACIAGAISGAYLGVSALPREWVEQVENGAGLQDVGRRLFEAWERSRRDDR